jgi:hypothetical protein
MYHIDLNKGEGKGARQLSTTNNVLDYLPTYNS